MKQTIDDILSFITQRWSLTDANWLTGNCYWFSVILCTRFPELQIYYLPIQGHFVAGDGNNYYDVTGKIELKETPILFNQIKNTDITWYLRLLRDCIL